MKTTPPSMPDDGTQLPGSNQHRMAPGKVCDPVSPGSRRGLFVGALGPEGRVDCERAEARQANCGMRPQVRVKHPPRLPPGASCAVRACQAESKTGERATSKLAPRASRNGTAKPDRPETQHQPQEADWLNDGARCASYALPDLGVHPLLGTIRDVRLHLRPFLRLPQSEAEEVDLVRTGDPAILLAHQEPQAALEGLPDRAHQPLTGPRAPHEDIAIVGAADKAEPPSRQLPVELVEHDVGEQR
jgi:hypothetical protein